jgi:ParB-like nuclease domain
MKIDLHSLKMNPFRDMRVDPIDPAAVAALTASIKEDGFWGGVVVRKNSDGEYEIVCGHHRVKAAIKAGFNEADIYIGKDITDESMVRMYARENATQRGNSSTALAGSIAGALKIVARKAFSEDSGNPETYKVDLDGLSRGVGGTQIERFLCGVPGINSNIIKQQLALLKSSGDYARILKSVQKEVEADNKVRADELQREAEKAARAGNKSAAAAAIKKAETASKKTQTLKAVIEKQEKEVPDALIDVRVGTVLTTPSVAETFYRLAKQPDNRKYLAVEKQYDFAKHLVKLAKETTRNGEINSRFIQENFSNEILKAKRVQHQVTKTEKDDLARQSWRERQKSYQTFAAAGARAFCDNVHKMARAEKDRPKDERLLVIGSFKTAVDNLRECLDVLKKHGLA